jgi:uncharacterized membrane protein
VSAKVLRHISLLSAALIVAASSAFAQQPEDPPAEQPSTPARPIILPMTPGSELNKQPKKPVGPRPRIITAPGASPVGAQPSLNVPAPASTKAAAPERPRNATSDYTFCNRTSYAASIAVGIRNGGLWLTRGWWTVPAGECKIVVKGQLTQSTYYVFARSSFAHTGPVRTWGGTQTLCIGNGPFQATSDGSEECSAGYDAQGFAKVETEGKAAWTTTLQEGAGYKTSEVARIAGLQRLLYDLGRFDGPVDGVTGPKFSEALTQARTELGVGPADAAGLYARLLAEATKIQAVAGLTFCNRTQDVIWTALGQDYQGKKESKGWWRLQPGACAKVIKDRLDDRVMYGFAAADRTEGVPETWGGTEQFCTKDSSFEIEDVTDCTGRGFTSTGFMKIETSGRSGLTFEFAPRRAEVRPE